MVSSTPQPHSKLDKPVDKLVDAKVRSRRLIALLVGFLSMSRICVAIAVGER